MDMASTDGRISVWCTREIIWMAYVKAMVLCGTRMVPFMMAIGAKDLDRERAAWSILTGMSTKGIGTKDIQTGRGNTITHPVTQWLLANSNGEEL